MDFFILINFAKMNTAFNTKYTIKNLIIKGKEAVDQQVIIKGWIRSVPINLSHLMTVLL